ncbi:MAG TPA: WD40 repeat domain-containing protein [Phycisphaerales bacterium]|nr:WD40 repeat domain-containing protein [Phycisphaerales bacterium]
MKNKKKSPMMFALCFAVIVILMFIANYRSTLVQELDAPNEGIEKLYTVGNSLIAISDSDDVYIWDWKELDSEPIIQTVPSEKLLCLDSGKIIIAPSNKPATVTVTNLKQSNKNKPFSFGYNWLCKHLSVTRNGQWVALAFIGKTGSSSTKRIRLAILGPGSEYPKEVLTLNYQKDATVLNETVISEDGLFIAVAGMKNNVGWVGIIDVEKKTMLWEKQIETANDLTDVAFSPNAEFVYAAGEGTALYCFETISGNEVQQFMTKDKSLAFNEHRLTCLEVSPNGSIVAAGVNPGNAIHFWDTATGKHLGMDSGCRGLNNLTFSPDSSMYVVAGRNYGGTFKVRRVPGGASQ